jgi:actin-related protein 5
MEREALEIEVKALDEQLLKVSTEYKTADTIAKDYQIHLLVDRIRTPEPLFQPQLCGLDQAGLGEILANLLARTQTSLFADVFLTGGTARFPGLPDRILSECKSILPQGFPVQVCSWLTSGPVG